MHPINKLLSPLGLSLSRIVKRSPTIPEEIQESYERNLAELRKNNRGFYILEKVKYEGGQHPISYADYECGFAAYHLNKLNPERILDIGSYRYFIIGLLSHYHVTTIDIRSRDPISANENIIICDAKNLDLPDSSFDAVVSLSSLEHFGLGRYGDEFDPDADKKAFYEMVRVLKPGGHIVFTTGITRARPCIVFNAHRIYNYNMLREFCSDLICIDEKFFMRKIKKLGALDEITSDLGIWDSYFGCWQKQ